MREIKFRAWHLDDGMVYFDFDTFKSDYHDQYGNIMQYTGLKDKNGKEIYSDDLLEDVNGELMRVYKVEGGFIVKAKYWSPDCSDLNWDDELIYEALSGVRIKQYIKEHVFVVGNIYENPELL